VADESSLPPPRHEPTDVGDRVIWVGAPALIATVIVMALLVLWLFPGRTVDRTMHLPLAHYPRPELQVSPRDDMARFRAQQLQWLNSAGWVDKTRGIAHIPIEDAMREVAEEGIAGWPAAVHPTVSPVQHFTQNDSHSVVGGR
jgi:hypothetical protein